MAEHDPLLGTSRVGHQTYSTGADYHPALDDVGDVTSNQKSAQGRRCWCLPTRWSMAILTWWGGFNAQAVRVNLNIALVSMVNTSTQQHWNSTDRCPNAAPANSTIHTGTGTFNWDPVLQSLILGAFYYGYPIMQVPGGYLAERFGPKIVFGVANLIPGFLTLLTPTVTYWDPRALIVVRSIMGFSEGPMYPSHHVFWTRWAPPTERGKIMGFSFTGGPVGTVVSYLVSGILCDSSFLGGWPSCFYLFGSISCTWFVIWMIFASNSPAEHKTISLEERAYIEEGTQAIGSVKV